MISFGAHDRLVGLDHETRELGDELARPIDFLRVDVRGQAVGAKEVLAGARPLAQAVDGALDLSGAVPHAGQGVGDRHTQVVVAVGADDALADAFDITLEPGDDLAVLVGKHVTHRVRDVQRGRAGLDHRREDLDQERDLAAAGVLRRELDVVGKILAALDRLDRHLQHLAGLFLELVLHVDRRSRDERVDSLLLGRGQSLARRLDVVGVGAGQGRDRRAFDLLGHELGGLELGGRGNGEPRLDDVDPEHRQLPGDLELLRDRHGRSGRLLAVAERCIEDQYLVTRHCWLSKREVASGRSSVFKRLRTADRELEPNELW